MTTTTITEKGHTGIISLPPSSDTNNLEKSVFKKPVRLAPDRMGVVLYEPFVRMLHNDDELTWVQQILTDDGLCSSLYMGCHLFTTTTRRRV